MWFDTQGEEAAAFYVSLFPRSEVRSTQHWGPENPEREGQALTVEFVLDGTPFVALNAGPEFSLTEAVSFQIACADQAEVDHYWEALTEDGEQSQCGWLKDRYGLSWQVVPTAMPALLGDPDPGRSQRAMQAMLGMRKLDIAALQRAADGD